MFFIRTSVTFLGPAPRAIAASSALLLSATILYPWMISLMFFCTGQVVRCILMRPRHFSRSRVSLLQFLMPSLSMSSIILDSHRFRMPTLLRRRLSSEMNENIIFFASGVSPSSFSNLLTCPNHLSLFLRVIFSIEGWPKSCKIFWLETRSPRFRPSMVRRHLM